MGLELKRNQKQYRWWGSQPKACTHAIGVKGNSQAYEVGLIANGDAFQAAYDPYDRTLAKKVGPNCETLVSVYTKFVAVKQAKAFAKSEGWTIVEKYDEATEETIITLRQYD
jgi:hypothetical protein